MYQGNIGLIKNRTTGESEWYQKLRFDNNAMFVNVEDKESKLNLKDVDETGKHPDKQYYIVLELGANEVLKITNYKIDNDYGKYLIKEQQLAEVQKQIDKIEEQLKTKDRERMNIRQSLINKKEEYIKIMSGEMLTYTYIYGKHVADDREFCWINDKNLKINIGDTVNVDTYWGNACAVVTRIEESTEKFDRRPVISIC